MEDFYNGLHPDDREATTAAYLAATDPKRRALYDVEYRTIGKEDGVERWVAAKGRGVFDLSERCVRVAGTALEITGRKAAEVRRIALVDLTNVTRDLDEPADIAHAAAEVLGKTPKPCTSVATGPLLVSRLSRVCCPCGITARSSTV
jgi:hypothetical protein